MPAMFVVLAKVYDWAGSTGHIRLPSEVLEVGLNDNYFETRFWNLLAEVGEEVSRSGYNIQLKVVGVGEAEEVTVAVIAGTKVVGMSRGVAEDWPDGEVLN